MTTQTLDTKKCAKCKEEKTLDLYSKNKSKKDGLQTCCKQCNHENRIGRKAEIAAYMRSYRTRPLAKHKRDFRDAAVAARNAGKIEVKECAECKATEDLQMHHLSYDDGEELNVKVLCRTCHHIEHRTGPAILVPARLLQD